MEKLKPLELIKELKDAASSVNPLRQLKPVYFVYGEELFVRERVIKRLKDIVIKAGGQYERVNFGEINLQEFVNGLYDISLFTPLRFIVASEVSGLKNDDMTHIIRYCENPSPDIILLLLSFEVDRRKKNITTIISNSVSCEAQHPKDHEMEMWIKGMAAERGKKLAPETIDFIKDRNGNDLSGIEKEIEKAALFVDSKDSISLSDMETVSSGVSGASVFDLLPHIASKNKGKALATAYKLIELGEKPIGIVSMYMGRLKKMLIAKELLEKGADDSTIIKEAGIHPYFFQSLKSEIQKQSYRNLQKIYQRTLLIDKELKSSRREKIDILSTGLLDIINI